MKMHFEADVNHRMVPGSDGVKKKYAPIPGGWYIAKPQSLEERVNKNGNGSHLLIIWAIASGPYDGRLIFDRVTMQAVTVDGEGAPVPNEMAMSIGRKRLSQMSWALCHPIWDDTEELVGRMCKVRVVIRHSEKYGPSNDIKVYQAMKPEEVAPLSRERTVTLAVQTQAAAFDDDDVPF